MLNLEMWYVAVSESNADPESRALPDAEGRQRLSHSDEKRDTVLDRTTLLTQLSQRGGRTQSGWNLWEWKKWSFASPEKHLLHSA